MGASMPFTWSPTDPLDGRPKVVGRGPRPNELATNVPCTPGARPGPVTTAMEQGDRPAVPLAPFVKLDGVIAGPGAVAVRLKLADWPPVDATTTIGPAVEPAVTFTCAWPFAPVRTEF